MKEEATGFSEMVVIICQSARRHVPEVRNYTLCQFHSPPEYQLEMSALEIKKVSVYVSYPYTYFSVVLTFLLVLSGSLSNIFPTKTLHGMLINHSNYITNPPTGVMRIQCETYGKCRISNFHERNDKVNNSLLNMGNNLA